ncbi:MAG: hypothetical protein ACOCTL_03170 [Candidatus Hadarchaeota archaeon]
MTEEKFQKKKKHLFDEIKSSDNLDPKLKKKITNVYGKRGEKAIEVLENDGVKRTDGRWIVQGSKDEYEIVKTHCSCYDYVLNIVTGKADVDMCYHALAKKIKELLNI